MSDHVRVSNNVPKSNTESDTPIDIKAVCWSLCTAVPAEVVALTIPVSWLKGWGIREGNGVTFVTFLLLDTTHPCTSEREGVPITEQVASHTCCPLHWRHYACCYMPPGLPV